MNIEDIKVGETYNVRMKVTNKEKDMVEVKNPMVSVYGCDYMIISHKYIHEQPKYDPCREFRAGDKVELKTNLGRNPYDTFDGQEYIPDGTVFTVLSDEWAGGKVDIFEKDESDAFTVHFSNLELVTPIEELEPYCVRKYSSFYAVEKYNNHTERPATYDIDSHPHAKAAAEAECDRLNEEYRKEQSNG